MYHCNNLSLVRYTEDGGDVCVGLMDGSIKVNHSHHPHHHFHHNPYQGCKSCDQSDCEQPLQ